MEPEDIEAMASEPIQAGVDGRTATKRSAADFIALDQYAATKRAKSSRSTGIRFFKITKGSNVGDDSAREGC